MANGGNDSQAQSNCALCTEPDELDDMVACDWCDLWHHFSCAKVDATVEKRKWYCNTCELLRKVTSVPEKANSDPKVIETGTKPKNPSKLRSEHSVAGKSVSKSDAGSKTSKKTRESDTSLTSSVRARLAMELKILEEQRELEEQELVAEKKLKDQQLKCEQELREQELAIEAKKLAEQKAFLERRMMEENAFRMRQLAIRKQSMEEKAKLIRQASQCGSSRSSSRTTDWISIADSKEKVMEWLEESKQQTEGAIQIQASTSAVLPDGSPVQVVSHDQALSAVKKIGLLSPRTTNNKDCLQTCPPHNPLPPLDRPSNVRESVRYIRQGIQVHTGVSDAGKQGETVRRQVFDDLHGLWRSHPTAGVEPPETHRPNDPGVPQNQRIPQSFEDVVYDGPTSRQLAARQVMGKDLPTFTGNPEDWPIWISNFERSTNTCGFSQDENLIRLQRCLRGPALEAVRGRLLCPSSVPQIIKTLELRYGRPEILIRTMTERIRQLPCPDEKNLVSLIEFGLAVTNLVEHLKTTKQEIHLSNPSLLYDLVSKLPVDYRMRWSAYKSTVIDANLSTFGSFMNTLVELAYEVVDDVQLETTSREQKQKPKSKPFVQAHSEPVPSTIDDSTAAKSRTELVVDKTCIACKEEEHKVADCPRFKTMEVEERWCIVQHNGLCKTCLNIHGDWPCRTFRGCGIENCQLRHHKLLHSPGTTVQAAISTSHLDGFRTLEEPLFRILPVTLYGKKRTVNVFAFIDEGSQLTLLEDSVAEQLGMDGAVEPLSLQWTADIKRTESKSRRITTEISGTGLCKRFSLSGARTVEKLSLPSQSLHYPKLAERHPHLRGLPLQDYERVSPKLLIGLDNLKLTVPLKVREGECNDPIAVKCRLGWSVYGCSKTPTPTFACGLHVGGWTDAEVKPNEMIRDSSASESVGDATTPKSIQSDEDRRASRIVPEPTIRRVPNVHEADLLCESSLRLSGCQGLSLRGFESDNRTERISRKNQFLSSTTRIARRIMPESENAVKRLDLEEAQCAKPEIKVERCAGRSEKRKRIQPTLYGVECKKSVFMSLCDEAVHGRFDACCEQSIKRLQAGRKKQEGDYLLKRKRSAGVDTDREGSGTIAKLALLDVVEGGKPEPKDYIGLRAGECYDEHPCRRRNSRAYGERNRATVGPTLTV